MKKLALVLALASVAGSAIAQDKPVPELKPFTMDGELGVIVTTGNTETSSFSAGITAQQELEKWTNDYRVEALYKKETTEEDGVDVESTSAHRVFGSAQANYKLDNPDHRLFGFASYEDNRLSNFDYQSTLAAGWSQKLWGTKKSSFEYSVGPGYSFAETQDGEDQSSFIVRGSVAYKWFISDTAKFTQTLSTEVGSENTKSRAESALSATISGALSMKLSLKLDHNTDVDDDVEKLDTETAITLVYSFF
jgi:putative salt-induced outer membrane protein YdiY